MPWRPNLYSSRRSGCSSHALRRRLSPGCGPPHGLLTDLAGRVLVAVPGAILAIVFVDLGGIGWTLVVALLGCACVSVRSSTEYDVLERVWGAVPHRRLEESTELAKHVRPLFGDALRAAAATRRRVGPRYALGARLDGAFAGG